MQVNEERAIEITMEHGYKGNEFNTKAWKERGCLKPDETQEALIEKLETIYNYVQTEKTGKKRIYILTDKKGAVTKRKMNYKGRQETVDETTMRKYLFNMLVKHNDNIERSIKGWTIYLKMPDGSQKTQEHLEETIKKTVRGFKEKNPNFVYNSKDIVSNFYREISNRSHDVFSNTLGKLVKLDKIKLHESFNIEVIGDGVQEVNSEEYQEIMNQLTGFLDSKGYTYYQYFQAVNSRYKTRHGKRLVEMTKDYLRENHYIVKLFKRYRIEILNNEEYEPISNREFHAAYFNRLVYLANKTQNKKEYSESPYFRKRFFLYNTLILLKEIGCSMDILIKREERDRMKRLAEYHKESKELEYQSLLDRHAFGELPKRN